MALLSSLTLENFRSFRQPTTFALAPLTVLTGPNSSGKSSLLKALLFLRHNARLGRLGMPTFSGGGHRLGSLSSVRSHGSKWGRIKFGLAFDWGEHDEWTYRGDDEKDRVFYGPLEHIRFELGYDQTPNVYEDHLSEAPPESIVDEDRLWDYAIGSGLPGRERRLFSLRIEKSQEVEEAVGEDAEGNEVLHHFEYFDRYYEAMLFGEWFFEDREDAYRVLGFPEVRNADAEEAARLLAGTLRFRLSEPSVYLQPPTLTALVEAACNPALWEHLELDGEAVDEAAATNPFLAQALRRFVRPYLLRWTEYLNQKLGEVDFVGAYRASSRRLYADDGADAFTDLLRAYFRPVVTEEGIGPSPRRKEVRRLLEEFGIGDGLHVERVADAAYTVRVGRGERQVHLADLGYGFTQLVPLILHAALDHDTIRSFPTILVEEPEANLHPNLQAKLADLFTAMSRPERSHLVVETHSEYLIRRLQYLVAKGEVEPGRVALYYLGPDPEAEDYVRRIEIDRHGQLSQEFGAGFLDEATNLMVNLYKYGSEN